MEVKVSHRITGAERDVAYRRRGGDALKAKNAARMRNTRAAQIPHFVGVDSEGIGRGARHRAVLLGVGERQYVAADTRKGLHWQEVFEFLYASFEEDPTACYVGFFLSYDFNQWLKSLPRIVFEKLATTKGKAKRKMTTVKGRYHPVRYGGWEFDMLGWKRLQIRPAVCSCKADGIPCMHDQKPWMYICDAGSYFQTAFLNVIEPTMWLQDPDGPVCTDEELALVIKGKNKRATAHLDDEMKLYNRLENMILGRVMVRLAKGFASVGVKLSKNQWYGPGATASKWLRNKGAILNEDLLKDMPGWFFDICRKTYYGGWFEIFSHGLIYGKSYNYDINNAYPYAATKLPHLCNECNYRKGRGNPPKGDRRYLLVQVGVSSASDRIGPVPYRAKDGSILRPRAAIGWYWASEIDAAIRAGLVDKISYKQWAQFTPCDHEPPFTEIKDLYQLRLDVGKYSAQGMAIKLNNNSIYGKFAQSVGQAPYNNWFYASYITSHCRTQILDAIATHPGGVDSTLMVATDGVCFDSPHPNLPVSKRLGEWDDSVYVDLCLFKPGVYWHKGGKKALLEIKSRGVPKKEFAAGIAEMERKFQEFHDLQQPPGHNDTYEAMIKAIGGEEWDYAVIKKWPNFRVPIKFRMKSCKQALNEGNWGSAGQVQTKVEILQDSNPYNKRRHSYYNTEKQRIDSGLHDFETTKEMETTYYQEAIYPKTPDYGFGFEGAARSDLLEAAATLRGKPANYDLPIEEFEWETVWDGGPV